MAINHISPNKLDIKLVASNLAVGSGPTESSLNLYQSNIGDVIQFLNNIITDNSGSNNPKKWMIINLRAEMSDYSPTLIHSPNEYINIPILDCMPPLFRTLLSLLSVLSDHDDDFKLVHCTHGKGRTGTIVVCYLIWKYGMNFEEANNWFIKRRSKDTSYLRLGVSICSQVRYCQYFESFSKLDEVSQKKYVSLNTDTNYFELVEIKMTNPFRLKNISEKLGFKMRCFSVDQNSDILDIYKFSQDDISTDDVGSLIANPQPKLAFNNEDLCCCIQLITKKVVIGSVKFWINCELELLFSGKSELMLELPWTQMDGFKGTEKKGAKLFDSTSITIKRLKDLQN